ncbi:hypothetical protein P8452_59818 [Trifolium repens]|nr:hypothetical protein P8452_59818 [Trifolium repens]
MELKKLILNIPWNLMMIVDFPELRAMEIHIDHGQKEGDHHFPTFLNVTHLKIQLTNHWLGKWNWVSNGIGCGPHVWLKIKHAAMRNCFGGIWEINLLLLCCLSNTTTTILAFVFCSVLLLISVQMELFEV